MTGTVGPFLSTWTFPKAEIFVPIYSHFELFTFILRPDDSAELTVERKAERSSQLRCSTTTSFNELSLDWSRRNVLQSDSIIPVAGIYDPGVVAVYPQHSCH